jgi:EAL domain-containing protein (putative c-di-GMP-specific phosphodiesterase class I)
MLPPEEPRLKRPPTGDDRHREPLPVASDAAESQKRLVAAAYRSSRIGLEEALRRGWLEIWYQPKIELRHQRLAGAEALARIRHPDLGVLLPQAFLAESSEQGLAQLAEYALLTTLRDWSVFDGTGFNLHLAINLPADALLHLPIVSLVQQHRPEAEHWPGLILEVTESQILRHMAPAQHVAKRLRRCGVTVAVDDFRAGYTSLATLPALAFAEIKLDCSLVKDCAIDADKAALCRDAIALAHRFGSVAVAEGIEHNADLLALKRMRCDFAQGVLIAPPMPLDGFLDLLRQRGATPSLSVLPAARPSSERKSQSAVDRLA